MMKGIDAQFDKANAGTAIPFTCLKKITLNAMNASGSRVGRNPAMRQ